MIPTPRQVLLVRSARDRLIDLLGIGETYPLQDVVVEEAKLTVDFDKPSEFYIDPGQKDVRYELFQGIFEDVQDAENATPVGSCDGMGKEKETKLMGPDITVDMVFQILASKIERPARKALLFDTASIKVGLDLSLSASIAISKPEIDLLNPGSTSNTAPRIADYFSKVTVIVAGSQAGAHYRLIDQEDNEISLGSVPGGTAEISLCTKEVTEDITIRIAVTRTFDPSEGRTDLAGELDKPLPLAVRANPALDVSIDGGPLVDPDGNVTISIAGSQESVQYSAYVRTLLDEDFAIEPPPGAEMITVSVAESLDVVAHDVHVRPPVRPTPWREGQVQDGYAQQGTSSKGNGATLQLTIEPLHEDSAIVIQAHKDHLGQAGKSELQLVQPVVALPRPDSAPALTLAVAPSEDNTTGTMLVSGGQAGVFYHFREDAAATEIGLPAYFHRVDEQDPELNRGLEQLRIEMDFAIPRDQPGGGPEDLERLRPLAPIVDIAPLPAGDNLRVMAVKARTGVGWLDSRTIAITKL